jgi:CBS domain-containing protein
VSLTVKDVMIDDAITIRTDHNVKYAESLMRYFNVKSLVALRDRIPIGIITLGDVVQISSNNKDPNLVLVQDVISEPLIWVKPDTPLDEAVVLLFGKNIDQVPVIGELSSGPLLLGMLTRVLVEDKLKTKSKVTSRDT